MGRGQHWGGGPPGTGQWTVVGRLHLLLVSSSSFSFSQQFNSRATAAVEGGPCSSFTVSLSRSQKKGRKSDKKLETVIFTQKSELSHDRNGENLLKEESSQIFRQLENLKVCNEFRSQTARLCLSCKHFTWQKYGILNALSESDFSHKPGVILK